MITNELMCQAFSKLMYNAFEMSTMGEHIIFLGLWIKQVDSLIYHY